MKTARNPSPSPYITAQQKAVLAICREHVLDHGKFPTRQFIQTKMGWVSEQSAADALLGLAGAGYLRMSMKKLHDNAKYPRKRVFELVEGL